MLDQKPDVKQYQICRLSTFIGTETGAIQSINSKLHTYTSALKWASEYCRNEPAILFKAVELIDPPPSPPKNNVTSKLNLAILRRQK